MSGRVGFLGGVKLLIINGFICFGGAFPNKNISLPMAGINSVKEYGFVV